MRRELIYLVEGKIERTQFNKNARIKRMNKLAGITEMVLDLDQLDNTNNLDNGSPSNILLTYHMTSHDDFTHFEPYAPQYKKLKNEEIVKLEYGNKLNPTCYLRTPQEIEGNRQKVIVTHDPSEIGQSQLLTLKFPD